MDELRLERALRAGPPFATSYAARPLALDELAAPAPATVRRMLTIVAVAGLLLAAVVAALVIGSQLLPSPSRWELSVQVPRGAFNADWYAVSSGGGALTPLGDELPALAEAPRWSPDGQTLAYVRSSELWLASGDGGNRREIPQPAVPTLSDVRAYSAPVWSSDGTMLAVQWESCRIDGDVCEPVEGLDIYYADGRFRDYIDLTGMRAGSIVWSPDSSRVGYTACLVEGGGPPPCPFGADPNGVPNHRFVISEIGSPNPIAQFPIQGWVTGWTSAGRLLVSDTSGAYTMDAVGGDVRWVLGPFEEQDELPNDPPVWSSDGALVAWALRDDPVLRIRDAKTGIDRDIISFTDQVDDWAWISVSPHEWSPDNSQLVFRESHRAVADSDVEPPEVESTSYVVAADGQDLRRLDGVQSVGWRPAED